MNRILSSLLAGTIMLNLSFTSLAETAYETQKDLPYRVEQDQSDDMREKCRLDLYHPTNEEGFTTIIFLHAGGLKRGNRYIPGELMRKGHAVVAVGYRLSPKAKAPAYIEDTAAAVAWVYHNIEKYGGSKDKILLAGASAGGYMASMVGLDKRWLKAHDIDANMLAGIVSLSGQAITHVAVREEQGIKRDQPVIDELAPLYHVRKDAPPYLIVTGDRELELLGRYEENAFMARMMKVVGHEQTTLYELGGHNHAQVEASGHKLLLRFVDDLDQKTKTKD